MDVHSISTRVGYARTIAAILAMYASSLWSLMLGQNPSNTGPSSDLVVAVEREAARCSSNWARRRSNSASDIIGGSFASSLLGDSVLAFKRPLASK